MHGLNLLGVALTVAATAYCGLALAAVLRARRRRLETPPAALAPVSVLKPLCGAEPRLYENLRSVCEQDHPQFQIVCGVREADDPAGAVVERLQREFPQLDLVLVRDPRVHGANPKVSNLINLLPAARYDHLVIADADVAVPRDYLRRVCAPLAEAGVGVVTCLYRGHAVGGFWSRLGVQFIDDWFAPSVWIAHAFGSVRFGFGATLALRRQTLEAIGGFEALRDELADDWWLAERARRLGLRTVLSDLVVSTDVTERRAAEWWAHELRWLRTIRSLAPLGYCFLFVSCTTPVALAGALLARSPLAAGWAGAALALRLVLHWTQSAPRPWRERWAGAWSVPLRDALLLATWAAGCFGKAVHWRGQRMQLAGSRSPARMDLFVSDSHKPL
ncbi:MAG: bacteriohopanetetrol glucosamine biosynthesis glycosyltransferase HpnI [Sinobacteraceae bacterium]|nr:bacteriohopanetetrol glucosamine biosynthesis glycosyltransferase HpnI [Nevskiaceae bacterium]